MTTHTTPSTPSTPSPAPAVDLSLDEAGALAPLVTAQAAAVRVQAGAVLVDVRSEAGRAATGSIPGATVTDRYALDEAFDLTSAARQVPVLALDTPIVVVCGSVRGSGPVAAALRARGFTDVVHVEGGFGAWDEAGLPTLPPAQAPVPAQAPAQALAPTADGAAGAGPEVAGERRAR
ncbi:rhodanese-like domain-containing protein [Cellulomonas soli]|uniref:Rhodanese domain-containing protein n=1 Tax=Cellulomonas soli TaxID=931535 RepID=A0A512PDK7_9CELL|nr:rhodanese-like domain-containing protein [Cellulomonas soli]NYI60052.1 rhodanese-related sulfurtransferase [Cellulomonas soli]GEP69294.1 hypothetical protein CSO01_20090 [Cellulomonas soli]